MKGAEVDPGMISVQCRECQAIIASLTPTCPACGADRTTLDGSGSV